MARPAFTAVDAVLIRAAAYPDGLSLPPWWVEHDPEQIVPTPGGHANFGTAHGVTVISWVKPHHQGQGPCADGT